MWAASTLIPSLRPCHCPPNFFSTTAKPSQADLPAAAVSAKFRGRRQRHKNHDEYGDEYGDDEGGGGEEEEIGGLGQAVVSALKSDPLPKSRAGAAAAAAAIISSSSSSWDHHHRRKLLKQQQRKGEADEQNTQLSGSDVLWALQRVAHKNKYHNHNHNTNKTSGTSSSSTVSKSNSNTLRRQEEVEEEDTTDIDYYCNSSNAAAAATTTTIPPFCIKSEWTSRLDELDKRLHHLLDT